MNNNDFQKQLAKLRRNKKFLWLGILFFVLVVLWILVSIFATTKTSVISQELRDLSQSFVPRLESKVFDEISGKRAFTDEELSRFSIFIFGKNDSAETSNPIDIMIEPDSSSSSAQVVETETEESATASAENTTGAELQAPKNASASPSSVPQSVTDFLDFMADTN